MYRSIKALALGALIVFTACEDDSSGPSPSADDFVFITTTDFSTGSASIIRLDDLQPVAHVASIHSDAVARHFGGRIFVVNRFGGDNIQILDPSSGFATVDQFSVGNGSDPHDIVVVNNHRAYVSRYNSTELWIMDPSNGNHFDTVDLSALADDDGIPEMDHMALVGDRLFVSVQRVDRNAGWGPVGESYLVVIDASSDEIIDTILLEGTNPYSEIVRVPGTGWLCVSNVGNFGVRDDGLEVVDPVSGTSNGIFLRESDVGGDITDVAFNSASTGFVIVSDDSFSNLVLSFDTFAASPVIDTLYAPEAFVIPDLEISRRGQLFVGDRTPLSPGVRVYDADTRTPISAGPINVGLPPFDLELVE